MNNRPTGWLVILGDKSGIAEPGTLLTARPNSVEDADGIGFIRWQWLRDGKLIAGAKAQKYRVTSADEGHAITVRMAYQDGAGNDETVTSRDVVAVLDPITEALHAIYFVVFGRRGDDAGMAFYSRLYRSGSAKLSFIVADMERNKRRGAR